MAKVKLKPPTKKQITTLVMDSINRWYEKTAPTKKTLIEIDQKNKTTFRGAIGLFKKVTPTNSRVFDLYRFRAEALYDEDELNDPENEGLEQEWEVFIDPVIDFKPDEEEWVEKKAERTSDRDFMSFWL